ncbi:hypothetical protein B0J13DRAFT_514079 [Dactylonectria estremocensis]|uniref:Zn(2)-C6 fungal-type domain-containing protein n=1 Tax=Dactylonectria estremocensis TaxID=1079267 RepID=A0A9P9IEV8_9HYPO|nr:hypothetical protein B0J13DRAFT_514079 [Dactylonectria estremocensis]
MSSRVPRQRNISTRNRNGCVTCRARRLKCDETKPECNRCTRLGLPCGGYTPRIIFKDQTEKFNQNSPRRTRSKQRQTDSANSSLQYDTTDIASVTSGEQSPVDTYLDPDLAADLTSAPESEGDAIEAENPTYHVGQSHQTLDTTASLPVSTTTTNWTTVLVPDRNFVPATSANEVIGHTSSFIPPVISPNQDTPSTFMPDASNLVHTSITPRSDYHNDQTVTQIFKGIRTAPIIPRGLLQSMKFPEDMLYYHHLRDTSPYGVLSILYLNDLTDACYLDQSVYHAALALSAIKVAYCEVGPQLRRQAKIHALEHFVTALGIIGKIHVDDEDTVAATPNNLQDPEKGEMAVSWLSTVLFLAYYELQRGQMRLWYIHSRAAIDFLSSNLSLILATNIGESLVRAFSRISALLDIYNRTHVVQKRVATSEFAVSLIQSLRNSSIPYDRLHYIMPRVYELEEEWRSNPRPDERWDERVDGLKMELEQWRESLPPEDVPAFDDEQPAGGADVDIKPCTILTSHEPVRAGTNFAHYLVSILRLDMMYSPAKQRQLTPAAHTAILRKVCRIAQGLPQNLCAIVNQYGHGILPAMINAYHISETIMADWIKKWTASLSDAREGIWDIDRVQRLLAYLDGEYSQNLRPGWTIIKTRMVDLDEDRDSGPAGGQSSGFCVEIYSKGKRGWSTDFIEIP